MPAAPVVSVIMGGAAHLAGATAAQNPFPVPGVPMGTLAIGSAGANNAALPAFSERMQRRVAQETLP